MRNRWAWDADSTIDLAGSLEHLKTDIMTARAALVNKQEDQFDD